MRAKGDPAAIETATDNPPSSDASGAARGASISVEELTVRYDALEALGPLSLDAGEGEAVGIVGPSGCGKTTLLEAVAGQLLASAGTVSVAGQEDPVARQGLCAYMPQRDLLLDWLTAIDNAALAPRLAGSSRAEARASAAPLFERFGLAGFEQYRPEGLSGGMRQRVALLRTLLADRQVLLLDEPFASLDALTRGQMQAWLAGVIREEGRTCLLVTHDVEEALYLCDRTIVLSSRPGRALAEISSPSARTEDRATAVTSPTFSALRAEAMRLLEAGG